MTACNIPDTNPLDAPCVPSVTPTPVTNKSCGTATTGGPLCPINPKCSPWDLSQLIGDTCFVHDVVAELLNVSGAVINVYKLLGVHEQGLLVDLTGNGEAISSGDIPNYPAAYAFDKYITEWRSRQLGTGVVRSAFIGYDFGSLKLANGRERYGIQTYMRQDVSTIKIKQGCDSSNRATKVRVERSDDGSKWYGVALLDVPDCDGMVTLNFAKSVPSRWWRVRPVVFNGSANDWWSVQALQFIDYEVAAVGNIQDRILMENRDRDYATSPTRLKGSYSPIEISTFQSKFGNSSLFGGSESYSIEISFAQSVAMLGRPLVIGDIIQLPSETQYSPSMKPVLKYLEITNITWSSNGYTANWVPTIQRIIAEPVIASQETQDIFGKLTEDTDGTGLVDINDGNTERPYQDLSNISETVRAEANTMVPERGEDYAGVADITKDPWVVANPQFDTSKVNRNRNVFGVDAMPPNGLPFTQGDDFPTAPADGDYHRQTFTHVGMDIPARLYRYSAAKSRWIYMETDNRYRNKDSKPLLQEFLDPDRSTVTPPQDTNKTF